MRNRKPCIRLISLREGYSEDTFHSAHAEECNAVTSIDPITKISSAHVNSTRRSHEIHKGLKELFRKAVVSIPFAFASKNEPVMAEHYGDLGPSKKLNSPKKKASGTVNTNKEGVTSTQGTNSVSSSNIPPFSKEASVDTRKRADLEIHFLDGERQQKKVVVDVTCSGIHKKSNQKYAGITSGVANYAAGKKDDIYDQYLHEGNLISFAVDSAGGLSDAARKFINDLYAKPKSDELSFWTCDKDRITLKVRFIDSLSCILARHRAMDIIRMGTNFHSKKADHQTVVLSDNTEPND